MKEKKENNQLYNMQQGQQPFNPRSDENSPAKGMHREPEDELLTTGGPVDRSAIEDRGNHGALNANTGGMDMKDEETNTSKDSFPRLKGGSDIGNRAPRAGLERLQRECDPDDIEHDYSQDKTEGIINPRTTVSEWAEWKTNLNKGGGDSNRGEGQH